MRESKIAIIAIAIVFGVFGFTKLSAREVEDTEQKSTEMVFEITNKVNYDIKLKIDGYKQSYILGAVKAGETKTIVYAGDSRDYHDVMIQPVDEKITFKEAQGVGIYEMEVDEEGYESDVIVIDNKTFKVLGKFYAISKRKDEKNFEIVVQFENPDIECLPDNELGEEDEQYTKKKSDRIICKITNDSKYDTRLMIDVPIKSSDELQSIVEVKVGETKAISIARKYENKELIIQTIDKNIIFNDSEGAEIEEMVGRSKGPGPQLDIVTVKENKTDEEIAKIYIVSGWVGEQFKIVIQDPA